MKILALLCDSANIREGLLNVLSGGISLYFRDDFPTTIDVTIAMLLQIHPTESDEGHVMRIVVQGPDGEQIARADAHFMAGRSELGDAGSLISAPLVVPMTNVPVRAPGAYSVEILVDKQHQQSIPFRVRPRPGDSVRGLPPVAVEEAPPPEKVAETPPDAPPKPPRRTRKKAEDADEQKPPQRPRKRPKKGPPKW